MQFKTKKGFEQKNLHSKQNNRLSVAHIENKCKKDEKIMEDIKVLCDRCFEDVIEKRKFYKVGSCNYCEECYEKIRKEFEREELNRIVLENYRKIKEKEQLKNDQEFFETVARFA